MPTDTDPVIRTESGFVRGTREADGLAVFRNIPYAAPPVGHLRFRAPAPVEPWQGERDGRTFGADCLQVARTTRPQDEDCLTLNIWSASSSRDRLPVLVFIHGGAFREGGASSPLYDAADLARGRGLVVVTFNYRLGPLGFLVSLPDGLRGNYGLWDQQAALEWVSRNARRFGGDPDLVTLFGESAGAMSIAVHLTLPASSALFHRAILQSNPAGYRYRTLAMADKLGDAFKRRVDCETLECLQHEPAESLLRAWTMVGLPRSVGDFIYWGPAHGAGSGIDAPPQMWRQLSMAANSPPPKPIMLGSNAHEGVFFVAIAFADAPMPRLAYLATVGYMYRLAAVAVLAQYAPVSRALRRAADVLAESSGDEPLGVISPEGWRSAGDHRAAFSELLGDYMFKCATRNATASWYTWTQQWRRRPPLYLYHFTTRSNHTGPSPCRNHACHMSELPFVFNRTAAGPPAAGIFSLRERALTAAMMDYWAAFARSADPNAGGGHRPSRPHWPAWTPESGSQLELRWPLVLGSSHCDATCDFWDSLGYDF